MGRPTRIKDKACTTWSEPKHVMLSAVTLMKPETIALDRDAESQPVARPTSPQMLFSKGKRKASQNLPDWMLALLGE